MQWGFLVFALWAALVELHSGTMFLAFVALAAFLAAVSGIWLAPDWLPFVFLALCVVLLPLAYLLRRRHRRQRGLTDMDIGQVVTVTASAPRIIEGSGEIQQKVFVTVYYRGTKWDAVIDEGPIPGPGEMAVIKRKSGSVLHIVAQRKAAPNPN